ncbi:MAG: hypothetical protein ACREMY_22845, partial [bacterium]
FDPSDVMPREGRHQNLCAAWYSLSARSFSDYWVPRGPPFEFLRHRVARLQTTPSLVLGR